MSLRARRNTVLRKLDNRFSALHRILTGIVVAGAISGAAVNVAMLLRAAPPPAPATTAAPPPEAGTEQADAH